MNIIVVVVVYDRMENIRKWLHSWAQCRQLFAKLFIVNNHAEDVDPDYWRQYCSEREANYIHRENVGFETGVIQDVLMGRMFKETDWDVLFFVTDDTIPMKTNFLEQFVVQAIKPDVGVSCMELSGVFTPHIRTTGWCIRREIAKQVGFTVKQITTKDECYFFEHQGGEHTLMSQILKMDKRVIQLSNLKESCVWDTHHHEDHNRWEEWHKEFPGYN